MSCMVCNPGLPILVSVNGAPPTLSEPVLFDQTDREDLRLLAQIHRRGWMCGDCSKMYEESVTLPANPATMSAFLGEAWVYLTACGRPAARFERAQRLVLHWWARAMIGELCSA